MIKIADIPKEPGIYQFYDSQQKILYIGKAKNLNNRISSYFRKNHDAKTKKLVQQVAGVKVIVVRNEVESLILEAKLIREHKPPYNIMLKDSTRYAYILVTDEEYPRIITARTKKNKGLYFGPYTSGLDRQKIISAINKIFKLRTCSVMPRKVCLQYHIKNCSGPCEGYDNKEEYNLRVKQAIKVLGSKSKEVLCELREEMIVAAKNELYEYAQELKEMIRGIKKIQEKQIIERKEEHEQHVIGRHKSSSITTYCVLHVHRGVISKKRTYNVPSQTTDEEFLQAYYRERIPPKEIISHFTDKNYEKYLSIVADYNVRLTKPKKGDKLKLLLLADKNASIKIKSPELEQLRKHLQLKQKPRAIDCFDISTHQGDQTVAACVRYYDSEPDPTLYRKYIIRGAKQDDFLSIEEAVYRRYKNKDHLPDLIVIDGGKGQLSAGIRGCLKAGIKVPIVSLAKKNEEVFVPGLSHSLQIPEHDEGLLLLRRIRDSVHRQAISFHRKKYRKKMSASALDHIPGLGSLRKEKLYNHFKTYDNIIKARKSELQKVLGEKTGAKVYCSLKE